MHMKNLDATQRVGAKNPVSRDSKELLYSLYMFKMLSLIPLVVALFVVPSSVFADACGPDITECEETVSKTVRSNSQHYWCFAKGLKWPVELKSLVKAEGIVSGDPHLGQFAVIPLRLIGGGRAMQFANVDFDDSGVAPFAMDFLRLAIAIKAIERDIQRNDKDVEDFTGVKGLLEAYKTGLKGKLIAPPESIAKDLKMSPKEYDQLAQDYVEGKLSGSDKTKLSRKDSEVEAPKSSDSITAKVAARYLPGYKVLDVVRIRKERGGSVNQDRFWVLVEGANSVKKIFEFKGWSATALESFHKQKKPLDWAASLYPAFWPQAESEQYAFKKIGSRYFWIREKRKSLTDIPYEARRKKDLNFLTEMSLFVANHLGLIHGRQTAAKGYSVLLSDEKVSEMFRQSVKEFMNQYLNKFKIKS